MTRMFETPPDTTTSLGRPRRVGVELEFGGMTCASAAEVVRDLFGGEVRREHRYRYRVRGTTLGDFRIELDTRYAHPETWNPSEAWRPVLETVLGRDWIRDVSELTGDVAELVLPCEIVSAPVPLDRLAELEALPTRLRDARAEGTADGWLYAFGLQLNPEAPATDAATILQYLRAFVVLDEWLRAVTDINVKRRLLAFADPYPERYAALVITPAYAPDAASLIDDYVHYNPTRNRGLDLLPLLAEVDEERVRALLPNEVVHKRPAFHYRLPDCRLRDPDWSIALEWNRWVEVERLAADPERLTQRCAEIVAARGTSWLDRLGEWIG